MSAASRSSAGPSARSDRDPDAELEPGQGGERVEVGRVVAGVEGAVEPSLAEQVRDRRPLVGADRRP